MNLNTHLELAGRLASDYVGAAYESGTHHIIATWAQAYLENKFARMTRTSCWQRSKNVPLPSGVRPAAQARNY